MPSFFHTAREHCSLALLSLLVVIALCSKTHAEANGLVLVLISPGSEASLEPFHQALLAHTSGLPVTLRKLPMASIPEGFPPDLSPRLAEEALLVVWVSKDRHRLYLWTPGAGGLARARVVPDTGEGDVSTFETMAAMVYSELETLVLEDPTLDESPPTTETKDDPSRQQEPPPPSLVAPPMENDSTVADIGHSHGLLLGLSASYAPVLVSSRGPVQHGAEVALFARFERLVTLDMGLAVDLMGPLTADAGAAKAVVQRWPLRLWAAGSLGFTTVRIGLALAAVLDLWRAGNAPFEYAEQGVEQVHATVGLAPQLWFSVRALPWLEPWLEIGADVFFAQREFYLEEERRLELGFVQPRALVGVTLCWRLSAQK